MSESERAHKMLSWFNGPKNYACIHIDNNTNINNIVYYNPWTSF